MSSGAEVGRYSSRHFDMRRLFQISEVPPGTARSDDLKPLKGWSSGLMYRSVPTTMPTLVVLVASLETELRTFARLKSMTFGTAWFSWRLTRMLDGLMPRWITPS